VTDAWLQEKDEMLKYVVEEVDRVKAMYEERLTRTAAEREAAREAAQAAEKLSTERLPAAELRAEQAVADVKAAAQERATLEQRLAALPQQLEVHFSQHD